jgi:signal peptidase I
MSIGQRWFSSFIASFWLILIVVIWASFAPTQFGGPTSFLTISGTSMEPNFHLGDLVIVHKESDYAIGDIIAYRNLDLDNIVFHRIIGHENDRFIMKGDNNSWVDSYHPLQEDVIGKLWIYVPSAGIWVQTIRQPMNMGLMAGALAGLIAISISNERVKTNKRMKRISIQDWIAKFNPVRTGKDWIRRRKTDGKTAPGSGPKRSAPMSGTVEAIFFALGLIAFASFMGGLIAFTRPATKSVPDVVTFQHLGFFNYSAPAPTGVYDSNGLKSGEPIFPKTTCSVNFGFQYTLVGNQPNDTIVGSYQLLALIIEPISGWQRTIPIISQTPFTGNAFLAKASFNVCQVETIIEEMENQTDFHPGSYTLSIEPVVRVTGTLSGHHLDDVFQPQLTFDYDRLHFFIIRDDPKTDPLNPSQAGLIRDFRSTANTISILGIDVSVPALRVGSIIFLLLSVAGLIGLEKYMQDIAEDDPHAFIQAKYGSILVDIQNKKAIQNSNIIEVTTIDDLAKLAERNNAMILHEVRGQVHYYSVDGNGVSYQYIYQKLSNSLDLGKEDQK